MNRHPSIPRRCLVAACAAFLISTALAQREEIVIPATKLAQPGQQADTPTPGKWWLNHEAQSWGAMNGTILMTGSPSDEAVKDGLWEVTPMHRFVPYRVPELVIDPHATGWYRIYIGLYRDGVDRQSPPHPAGQAFG